MKIVKLWITAAFFATPTINSNAAIIAITDQTSFLRDLATPGSVVHEDLKNSAWDGVRASMPDGSIIKISVPSPGIIWTSNNIPSEFLAASALSILLTIPGTVFKCKNWQYSIINDLSHLYWIYTYLNSSQCEIQEQHHDRL